MSSNLQSPVLSEAGLHFGLVNGGVSARNVVLKENSDRTAESIWEFFGDGRGWSRNLASRSSVASIMAEIYQHQTFWDNR